MVYIKRLNYILSVCVLACFKPILFLLVNLPLIVSLAASVSFSRVCFFMFVCFFLVQCVCVC